MYLRHDVINVRPRYRYGIFRPRIRKKEEPDLQYPAPKLFLKPKYLLRKQEKTVYCDKEYRQGRWWS